MSKKIQSVVSKVSIKAAYRANKIMKFPFRAKPREEEHAPVVAASSVYSQSSGFSSKVTDTKHCETVALNLRAQQDDLWEKEQEERREDLATLQLLHASGMSAQTSRLNRRKFIRTDPNHQAVQTNTPLSTVANPQQPAERTVSDTSDGTQPPAMWEQQTGIIREHHVEPDQGVFQGNESGSESSSIRRRGAVRLKHNPIHARPSQEEVKRYNRAQ